MRLSCESREENHITLRAVNPADSARSVAALSGELEALIDAGIDPSSRQAQIRGIGERLKTMVTALRRELEALGISKFDDWMADLDRLARLASIYEAD